MKKAMHCLMVAILLAGLVLVSGCGEKGPSVDTAPFEKTISKYLSDKQMELKVLKFKNIKVEGDTATATCSLKHKTLPTPAVQWDFAFKKEGDSWVVTSHKTK